MRGQRTMHRVAVAVAVCLLLVGLGGCGTGAVSPQATTVTSSVSVVAPAPATASPAVSGGMSTTENDEAAIQDGTPGRSALELKVLQALSFVPYRLAAGWEPAENRVIVRVLNGGEAVPDEMVQEMRSRAEAVTGGIPVVIEITNGGMWP